TPPPDERSEGAEPRVGEPPAPAPRPRSDTSSASRSLLTQSRAERAAGSYTQATASLERALRIDPNNAVLWIELGEIQLETGNTEQARMMARKALTLAGGERAVEAQAERLLRAARSP
ncbi:MAG TPA: tetratricopeptide repeat protein, partial [Gammaproteobacteria bacterium]|nr:tetratricopeptide repeat protein [Gammaproteobacteria bacterium]